MSGCDVDRVDRVETGLLALADRHRGAGDPPHRDRLRVVVAVQVRDQELADVGQPPVDLAEPAGEDVGGVGHRPAPVDQDEPVAVLDHVHVDRPQAVIRQGERDAMDPRTDRMRAGGLPRVPVPFHQCTVRDAQ